MSSGAYLDRYRFASRHSVTPTLIQQDDGLEFPGLLGERTKFFLGTNYFLLSLPPLRKDGEIVFVERETFHFKMNR